jgi:AraC-like DNA-binding protein
VSIRWLSLRKKGVSIVYIWLRSFLYVIAVIMIIFLICFTWIRQMIIQEITDQDKNFDGFIQRVIDSKFTELQRLSNEIEYNPTNLSLSETVNNADFTSLSTYRFTNQINNFMITNSFFEDIYIYYPATDFMVGNLGSYNSYSYYLLLNKLDNKGYDKWLETISTNIQKKYFLTKRLGASELLFTQHIPIDNQDKPNSILVVKINVNSISHVLKFANSQNYNNLVAIVDNENQIYAYDGDSSLLSLVSGTIISGQTVSVVKDKLILVQPSTIGNFKYVLISDKSNLFKANTLITRVVIIFFVFCIISGVLLSIFMSKKNVRPLLSIISRFTLNSNECNFNEYGIVEWNLNNMVKESNKIIQQMEKQQVILNQTFLSKLLKGSYNSEQAIYALARMYEVSFDHPYFCVAIIRLGNSSVMNEIQLHELHAYIKANLSLQITILYSEVDDMFAFLLNFDTSSNQAAMNEFCDLSTKFLLNASITAHTGFGNTYDNMSQIILSYGEALLALDSDILPKNTITPSKYQEQRSKEPIAERAKDIIDKCYKDPLLGLYSIADELGVSNSYTSKMFKSKYGIGILEYLNKVRIDNAKKLIADGNSIKSVALEVGFSSDISFIRVFKKYEQTTPGKYKK